MILFFHFVCILARYIVSHISKSISKAHLDEEFEEETINSSTSAIFQKCNGSLKQSVYEDGTLKFFPPVYVQRYETVTLILKDPTLKGKIRKIADFGCAELDFFMYLKNIEGVNEILEIDINQEILERYSYKAAPLTSDYLMSKANKPLDVYILAGSVEDYDDYLTGIDAVIAIELIEHLTQEAFNKMSYNVFHEIKPKIAIFTTPNADFNSLFKNFPGRRHVDHKFEWTRKEFYKWTQEIIAQFPEYCVRFYGIGPGPEGTENLGCCSQMAVFQRPDDLESYATAREDPNGSHSYKLIKHYNYPVYEDTRTTEEKILHEVKYQVSHIVVLPEYYNYDDNESEIPLSLLQKYVLDLCPDDDEFRNILETNGMRVEVRNGAWCLIYSEPEFNSSTNSFIDEDWLPEVISNETNDKCLELLNENWDLEDGHLQIEDFCFESARSIEAEEPKRTECEFSSSQEGGATSKEKSSVKSAPESVSHLNVAFESKKSAGSENKETEPKKRNVGRSKIPRKKIPKENEVHSGGSTRKTTLSYVCSRSRKISKSCSLDSCLENINCKPFEFETFYLNLIPGGSVPYRNGSSLSSNKTKRMMNDSGSSLFSSSLDRAADSGYPFSFSPPDADMTPEQVDELFTETEMMSRSSSASSEIEHVGAVNHRIHHDFFVEDMLVENGDLANNNRDGEGNNVEGLVGQRLVNELAAERDPNDNMMFFPEMQDFPPWLLNLVDLAERPVFIPLNRGHDDVDDVDDDNYDKGLGDDSSSDLNQSLDPEDFDFYLEGL